MVKYILKRLLYGILTIYILATLTFILMKMIPGDPFSDQKRLPPQIIKNMEKYYGLDKPLYIQYAKYMFNISRFDLGYSIRYQTRKVNDIIKDAFPYSAQLGIQALIYGVLLGLTLGVIASLKHNKTGDYLTMIIAVLGVSVPSFILAGFFQYIFAIKLRWFPVALWNGYMYTILPSIALGTRVMASQARMMRTSMLDVLNQDYIKTAKSKGLSTFTVVWKHTIRNAILPIVTILGPIIGYMLVGTFVIENIFAIPGLGLFSVQAIQTLDYPVIMGTTIFYASFIVFMNIVVDVVYGFIDPRIKIAK